MKKGWQSKPFEECIESLKYTRKIQRKDFLVDGPFPIVSQEAEFINGYWDNEADVFKVSTPVVIFGDHTRVLKYVDFDFVLGADGVKILPPREFLRPKFFFYQLQAANFISRGYARHYRILKELEIKYPPPVEQQRIVDILDEAFEGIAIAKANAEKNLQNAHALFESHLQSVFTQRGKGWVEKTLGGIGKVAMCKRIFKDQTIATRGIPFYKIGTFGKEPDSFIPSQIYNEYREKYPFPKKGDVLISASGTIGRRVIYDGEHAYFQDSNIVWIDNDERQVLNDYLYHFYGACEWNSTRGATISRLYNDNLKRIVIAFPESLHEQRRIVCQLDALDAETQRLADIYERKLATLVALKKSLLHQAFTGNLTKDTVVA